jgi:HSP20 family molecular chaperone IbpA
MGTDVVAADSKIKEDMSKLLEALDEKSRGILWHLWWYRHAEISQLRDLIDATSDFEVLHRLKEVINKQAQKLWGKPAVRFEQSRVDPLTGEKVLFSWWFLDEENLLISVSEKPLVDVFNEKDSVTVVAQLPTAIDIARADIQFRNGILKVRLAKQEK